MNSVANDLKARIKQSLEIMFRNQVSNEAKERARRHVEAERRARAAKQAAMKAARKPSPKRTVPPPYDFSQKTLDISQCGRIPKKETYSKSSNNRHPSRYSREHSPISSVSSSSSSRSSSYSSSASSREVSRSPSRSASRLEDDSPTAIELLKDHMKEIERMQNSFNAEEKYVAKLEEELRFLKSDKSESSKDHRRRVNDKIERANANLLETKRKLTSLIMKLPSLRNEAAIENSDEWQELLEKEAAEKVKADKEAKKVAEAKAAAEKRDAKQAEKRAKELEKAMKTIENRQKKGDEDSKKKESTDSDDEESEDISEGDSSDVESLAGKSHVSTESSDSEEKVKVEEKPLKQSRKRKLSESEISSSESSSEYNPSDASPPTKHVKRGLKRKRSTSLDHKENVPRSVKKMKSIPSKSEQYIKTEEIIDFPEEHPEEDRTTTLNQYYFGYDIKPLKHTEKSDLLSEEFWEEASCEQEYEPEEPRDFFVIPDPPQKIGVGARVRYDRRTPWEEYLLTMSMTRVSLKSY